MAERIHTWGLLARLRREYTLWKLERNASGYICTIFTKRGNVAGADAIMGKAIAQALKAAERFDDRK